MGKKALAENPEIRGSPLTRDEAIEIERLLYHKNVSRQAEEAEKTQEAVVWDQAGGSKPKSPVSAVKPLSGACVIFEKAGDSELKEVGRVSDNFLISVNDPSAPGSLAPVLLDIVGKDTSIKEDWNRENITAFMCSPTSTLTVIYRGHGGAFDQEHVSGVIAALKDASTRIYICLTMNDPRTKTFLHNVNKARQSPRRQDAAAAGASP
jgi:hypothetical protein